jgi:hypothetical protein
MAPEIVDSYLVIINPNAGRRKGQKDWDQDIRIAP